MRCEQRKVTAVQGKLIPHHKNQNSVTKRRPLGQIRPAQPFHPTREDIRSIIKK